MIKKIAGFRPENLLKVYRHYLFEDFLPFMDQYVVDHEHGGFKWNTDRSGNNITTNKRTWYDGRGIWVYSFLYNNFQKSESYLATARKTVDLLFKVKSAENELWPWSYSQTGKPLNEQAPDIYGNLFVAEGLIEFSIAIQNNSYLDKAREILLNCVTLYDREDYLYHFDYKADVPTIKVPRVLGHWMILLRLSTAFLKIRQDKGIEALAARCTDALLKHHLNKEFDLMIEFLERDLSQPKDHLSQFVYIGHSIEALWMVMDEATRKQDQVLFEQAKGMFKRHVEVAWDDVYGGVFHGLENVAQNKWVLEKVLWAQQEVLVGLMLLIARCGDSWAYSWFDKMYPYVIANYDLKKHGYSLWNIGGDRKMTFHKEGVRIENYHHPRHLMLNMLELNNLIKDPEVLFAAK